MARARWYEPLLTFLAEQGAETMSITLTLDDLAALFGGRLPISATSRSQWQSADLAHRLAAVGWRVGHLQLRDEIAITFERQLPDTTA